jgi:hypothetical protein
VDGQLHIHSFLFFESAQNPLVSPNDQDTSWRCLHSRTKCTRFCANLIWYLINTHIALHDIAVHYSSLRYIPFYSISLHFLALRYSTFHYIALHSLHDSTLHSIGYLHTCLRVWIWLCIYIYIHTRKAYIYIHALCHVMFAACTMQASHLPWFSASPQVVPPRGRR